MLAPVLWLIALELAGLLALPLAVRVFRRLGDGGYGLAKPLGLALVGYLCWLLSILGLLNYTQPTVWVLAALVAAVLWTWNGRAALAFLREQRGLVLVSEAVFVGAFVLAAVVRAYTPAINGQEKFMDMAIYHAFLRADQLPTEDPWLSGYGMAYYYFGYFLWSLVAKATDVLPAVGYNLALAGTLALLAASVFGLVYSLVRAQLTSPPLPPLSRGERGEDAAPGQHGVPPRPLRGEGGGGHGLSRLAVFLGILGALATAVMGNLQALVVVLARQDVGSPAFWRAVGVKNVAGPGPGWFPDDGAWWFGAARVIPNVEPDGITEFPWFSLLLGDLHPHFVALPYELLAAGLAIAALRNLLAAPRADGSRDHDGLDVAVAALGLGLLIPLNTWDVGTFWIIYAAAVAAALAIGVWRADSGDAPAEAPPEAPSGRQRVLGALSAGGGLLGATFGLALLLYVPYFLGYQSQPLGLGVVGERTMTGSVAVLFGPLLLLAAAAVVRGWLDLWAEPTLGANLRQSWWAVALSLALLAAVAVRDPTLALTVALLAGTTPLVYAMLRAPDRAPLIPAGVVLLVCALGLLLGTELIFLRDSFGSRMNTVFKFYYHVWLLLGLLSPLLALYLVQGRATVPAAERGVVAGTAPLRSAPARRGGAVLVARLFGIGAVALAGVLALAGLLYPLGATASKTGAFRGPATLDGAAWLESVLPGDADAIRWLTGHVPGRPVLVEAVGDDYSEYARVSTFAGLPTPIGWLGHELQWRGTLPEFNRRRDTVEAIYRTADPTAAVAVLQSLGAEYVYVGRLEADKYGPAVRDRFEGRLAAVYRAGDVVIYRVPSAASGVGVGLAEVRP